MAAVFAAVRRKRDSLLIYFALFATLYGLRLWMQSRLLAIALQGSPFYLRLSAAIGYLILIPAFLFFTSIGPPTSIEKMVGYTMAGFGAVLASANFIFGDSPFYHLFNNIAS